MSGPHDSTDRRPLGIAARDQHINCLKDENDQLREQVDNLIRERDKARMDAARFEAELDRLTGELNTERHRANREASSSLQSERANQRLAQCLKESRESNSRAMEVIAEKETELEASSDTIQILRRDLNHARGRIEEQEAEIKTLRCRIGEIKASHLDEVARELLDEIKRLNVQVAVRSGVNTHLAKELAERDSMIQRCEELAEENRQLRADIETLKGILGSKPDDAKSLDEANAAILALKEQSKARHLVISEFLAIGRTYQNRNISPDSALTRFIKLCSITERRPLL
jgi:chromosome segregation ATPase